MATVAPDADALVLPCIRLEPRTKSGLILSGRKRAVVRPSVAVVLRRYPAKSDHSDCPDLSSKPAPVETKAIAANE